MNHMNPDSEARRESARQTDGKFGTQEHAEPTGGLNTLDPQGEVSIHPQDDPTSHAAEPRQQRTVCKVSTIDKREARKRWERGLAILTWDSRDFNFKDGDEVYSDAFKTRDQVDATDFDAAVGSTRATTRFGKPDIGNASMYDTLREVLAADIRPGDRIDIGAVGNWKVRHVMKAPDGAVLLTMNGPTGDDDGPVAKIVTGNRGYVVGITLLHRGSDKPFEVAPRLDGRITRREPSTDPNVIRERIAEQFPNAVFGPDGTHTMYDGQIVPVGWTVARGDRPGSQTTVRWTPNTTPSDLVRPARRR